MQQKININLIPNSVTPVIHLSQNDYLNGELVFYVYHGSTVLTENIINAVIKGIKPDNNIFIYNATKIDGNVVTFDVKEQMTAVSGKTVCKLRIQTADGAKHSKTFILDCEADPTTDGNVSESDISALEELIESIEGDIVDARTAADEAADYAEQAKSTVVDVRRDITTIQQDVSSIQNDVAETKNDVSGLQTSLNGEISNRTTQDAVLSARMDEFTKLPDESLSTAADAELADIRVEAGGKTAATAGDAVREQFTELKSTLSNIFSVFVTANGSFNSSGLTTGSANRIRTDMISFHAGDVIQIKNGSFQHACGIWKNFIASGTIFRNDNSFSGDAETIKPNYDGYLVTVFRKSNNAAVTPSEFDGAIYVDQKSDKAIKNVSDSIKASGKSEFVLSDYFTFVRGALSNGIINTSTTNRVSCDTIICFDFDIILTIENGFKCGVQSFANGYYSSDSGWETGEMTVPAGTQFKIVIARYAEITGENADINLFSSMVKVKTIEKKQADERFNSLKLGLIANEMEISLPRWEQGGVSGSNGILTTSANDIRSCYALHIPAGTYKIEPNGKALYYFYYSDVGAYVENCSVDRKWGATSPFVITFSTDKYIRFVQNETGIVPSDATLKIKSVVSGYQNELKHFANGITIASKQGEGLNVPPASLVSIKEVFKNNYDGYRINVCKTSDDYYVLSHNRSINAIAKNPDNTDISETVNIDEHTLAELNAYDFGIRYGTAYAGMNITQLDEAVSLCAKLGLRLDIEWKYPTMTQADADSIYEFIVTNGYSNKNWHWIAVNETEIGYFKTACDYVDIEVLISSTNVSYYLPLINAAASEKHNVIVGYSDGNLTDEQVLILRKLNVVQNKGTATNIAQMIEQIESGVTEIECNFYNPKQAMIDYALSN